MSLRISTLILLLFAAILTSHSQVNTFGIKGKVVDEENQEPLAFANVVLMLNDSMIIGTVTHFNGEFTLKPIDSSYYNKELKLRISYIGYNDTIIKLEKGKNKLVTIPLRMNPNIIIEWMYTPNEPYPYDSRSYQWTGRTFTYDELQRMPRRP